MKPPKKRNKAYRPKRIAIPLMKETHDSLALDLHMQVEKLIGYADVDAYNELSVRFIAIGKVVGKQGYMEQAKQAMLDIAARFERVGKFGVNAAEAAALREASGAMVRAISHVSVDRLYQAEAKTAAWCRANGVAA